MITKNKSRKELQLLREDALEAYMNREEFRFDVNADRLYQQYKDHYTQLGKTAMEDTMGRASALTGGYGSSYAQSVCQQAYQSYLSKADDVIPELYQLAYDRYRDESKRLYRNYQAWARQEQEAAQQERWEQEYALAQQKLRAENARQEGKNSQTQTTVTQPDYWAMLSYHQNLGKSTESKSTATNSTATNSIPDQARYDNGKVSEGNIKTMQRVLGLQETGQWTEEEYRKAGDLNANDAWLSYQRGQLQNRNSHGQWEQGVTVGNIKIMEHVLGL
jgi:hypothetical protein